jgi:hypothetical protein
MPMHWRRMIDGSAFILAVAVGAYLRYGLEASWYAAIGVAVLIFIATPFVLSRVLAIYLIRRMERVTRRMDKLNS